MAKGHVKSLHYPAAIRRPGDNYFVDVQLESKVSTSGETVTYVGVALGGAPVPERRYVADICHVTHDHRGVKIIFGQSKLVQDRLRSAVVIQMSRRAIENFLSSSDAITNPSYSEIAMTQGISPAKLQKLEHEPEQVVTLAANLAISAMSGEEVSIDFLQLSPFSMAAMSKGARQASIDPVVRVDLNSDMFLGLIEELRRIPGLSKDLLEDARA